MLSGFLGFQKKSVEKPEDTGSGKFKNGSVGFGENLAKKPSQSAFSGRETSEKAQNRAFSKKETVKKAQNQALHETKEPKTRTESPKIDGKDIETVVKVSKEEVKRGTSRKINVLHTDKCPKCLGRRYFNGTVCALCHGAGEKSEHKIMNVKIPAGIKDGTKMKVKGEGEYGKFGGKNGDLYLLIQIEGFLGGKFGGNGEKFGGNSDKNSNIKEYMYATAFEGLIGYLYLTGKEERLRQILNDCI